ncbi:MAG: hypothetical protein F4051_06105 [Boseongicola sp. SB0670_bin_30]|nr:hypothetical protein [Boseongicola sp. SB0670_bin_30]
MPRREPTVDTPEHRRKRATRRPVRMPDPIDATPREISRAVLSAPLKRQWDFLKKYRYRDD